MTFNAFCACFRIDYQETKTIYETTKNMNKKVTLLDIIAENTKMNKGKSSIQYYTPAYGIIKLKRISTQVTLKTT